MSGQNGVTITDLYADPVTKLERINAFRAVINALLGTWGTKDWNGGLEPSLVLQGWWRRYSNYWEAKLVFDIDGTETIKLPFKVKYGVVRLFNTSTAVESLQYVQDATELVYTATGRYILRVDPVRSVK